MEPTAVEGQPEGRAPLVAWTPVEFAGSRTDSSGFGGEGSAASETCSGKESAFSSLGEGELAKTHVEGSKRAQIPDGGWGWVVVGASLVISLVADGVSFSFGLMYVELLGEFGESKASTAWVGSLFMAVPLLAGPIMSALVDRHGCRAMTIAGGLLSATGFVLSVRAKSLLHLYVFFGVLAGLGLGLCYVTAVVSIAFWFDRRRTLATGLGASGTGIGTFLFAPLTSYLLEEFGWRGTTLLLAGAFLNMCVCGAVMRDPAWLQNQSRAPSTASLFGGVLQEETVPDRLCASVVHLPTFVHRGEKVPVEVLEALVADPLLKSAIVEAYPSLVSCHQEAAKAREAPKARNHRLRRLRLHRNSVVYRGAMLNIRRYRLRASSCPDVFRNSEITLAREHGLSWWSEAVRSLGDFSLFLELHFLLVSLGTILLFVWFIVPYFYLAEMLLEKGYAEAHASVQLSVIGVASTVGMVLLGWAGDQAWLSVPKAYGVSLVLCGLSTISMYYGAASLPLLTASSAAFGFFFASSYSFTPAILMQLVPLERFTSAYGLSLLCQGIGSLLGPPLAGWAYDVTGTWQVAFVQAGIWIVVSGMLIAAVAYTEDRKIFSSSPGKCSTEV